MQPLLKSKETARILGIANDTLAKQRCLRRSAGLIPYTYVGRNPMYREEDIRQWLAVQPVRGLV